MVFNGHCNSYLPVNIYMCANTFIHSISGALGMIQLVMDSELTEEQKSWLSVAVASLGNMNVAVDNMLVNSYFINVHVHT